MPKGGPIPKERLIYQFATKSHSRRVHEQLYGWRMGSVLRACDLDTTFRFECRMTGNCCRGRSLDSNMVVGESQVVPILRYAKDHGIEIRGKVTEDVLWLDGLDPMQREIRVASVRLSRHKGIAYVGPHGQDCQFLRGNLCAIQPVKPVLCRTAPISFVLEHEFGGGRIHLAFQESKRRDCPECFDGPERIVRDWIDGIITNEYINDQRKKCGWPRLAVK